MSDCTRHPGKEAVGACSACGHLVCKACYTEINNKVYCPPCIDKLFTSKIPDRAPASPKSAGQPPAPKVEKQPEVIRAAGQAPAPISPVTPAAEKTVARPVETATPVTPVPVLKKEEGQADKPVAQPAPEPKADAPVLKEKPQAVPAEKPEAKAREVSVLKYIWWLAPVLLAFIGGTLAWLVNKTREPRQARLLLWAGIGLTVIYGLIIALIVVIPGLSGTSSQGGTIAFQSYRDGNWEIYVMKPDGSNQIRLTFTDNKTSDFNENWSSDGKKIVFNSTRDGNWEVYGMNADGSNQTRLTDNNAYDTLPAWSPDGKKIAFVSNRDDNWEIYTMDYDGNNAQRLTNSTPMDDNPRWSPDGGSIVFMSNRDGNNEIYVMNADGSNQRRLTSNDASDGWAYWSPDGKQLAFLSNRDGNWEIYIMNADGSNQKRVTFNSAADDRCSWSPDGKRIVFDSNIDGNNEIYYINPDGGNRKRLTNNKDDDQRPAWTAAEVKIAATNGVADAGREEWEKFTSKRDVMLIGSEDIAANKGACGANFIHYVKFTASKTGTINRILLYNTRQGDVKAALYDGNAAADSPTDKISANDNPVACSANVWNSIPIPPAKVTAGKVYWLSFIAETDVACVNVSGPQKAFFKSVKFDDYSFPKSAEAGLLTGNVNIPIAGYGVAEAAPEKKVK